MDFKSNDYVVKGILGEGSFSKVFKLQHNPSGKEYAGKFLKTLFKCKQDVINCTEINVMKRIEDHSNILCLKDLICESFPCQIMLVFDLMDMNLYEFLKDKQKPITESISRIYLYQIVCGLQHLHKNGLFHRDVKPENILLRNPNKSSSTCQQAVIVKLADFGCVKSIEMKAPFTEYIATRWYRAPECILTDGYYGPKMDIWSAGCIFYEMLSLKPLFPGENELDQLEKIHSVLGTPTPRILKRFRNLKCDFQFKKLDAIQFSTLLPSLSDLGLIMLQMCLNYLPETRVDSTKLLDHYYFFDMRHCTPNSARNTKLKSQASSEKLGIVNQKISPQGSLLLKQKKRDGSDKIEKKKKRLRKLS